MRLYKKAKVKENIYQEDKEKANVDMKEIKEKYKLHFKPFLEQAFNKLEQIF